MARKKKKSSGFGLKPVLMLMGVGALGVAGFAYYVKATPAAAHVPQEIRRKEAPAPSSTPQTHRRSNSERSDPNTIEQSPYKVPVISGDDVKLSAHVPLPPKGVDDRVYITTKTFESLGIDGGRALSVDLKDGIANIDVNEAFASHGYGSTEEGQVIKALQLALGQFKDIERFTMIFEGQQLDTLGNAELTDPIPVIRP